MKSFAVIPARLESTRLPRKILADICGKPLIWHVWTRVQRVPSLEAVYVATDSKEIADAVRAWGGEVLMTSSACRSGTERIVETLDRINADFILNVQGDEPLIEPTLLESLIQDWQAAPCDVITPVFRIERVADLQDPNLVKVVRSVDGRALYFSRSPIPFVRDAPPERWLETHAFWGHVGVYGYRREVLEAYDTLSESPLEAAEHLEQLKFLEAGYTVRVVETAYRPIGVDTPADLARVRTMMAEES